ncbi:hypothetical protein B7494_g3148 [Chlorociboria aeruginascens]|nr:hypothetical protein B7494_g3148 [Chlorociboria aeruginascens]
MDTSIHYCVSLPQVHYSLRRTKYEKHCETKTEDLQFCHMEAFAFLYWTFWTTFEVGAVIAMLGITINQSYHLVDKQHPPWAIALGTPVLIITTLGHLIHTLCASGCRRVGQGRRGHSATPETPEPDNNSDIEKGILERPCLSGATLQFLNKPIRSEEMGDASAVLVGMTTKGHPLLEWSAMPARLPEGAKMLKFEGDGGLIVQYPSVSAPPDPELFMTSAFPSATNPKEAQSTNVNSCSDTE